MDDVAREYLLITLALGKLEDGFVDAYFGPPEVREEALAAHSTPLELAQRAATLRDGLGELDDAQRARWLDRQLLAVETIARRLGGQQLPYLEEVERCFDAAAERTPAAAYEQVRRELDELLPGDGDLRDRLAARDDDLTVPVEALPGIVEWLAGELRASAERLFDVPAGERLSVTLVADKPWAAYNWYRGNLESLIEINTDLPTRATQLVPVLAHETFPGHHLEHISKEQRLVIERGYHESSVQLINTPESYVSEGLGEAGVALVAAQARWQELLIEICARAGIPMSVADAVGLGERVDRLSSYLLDLENEETCAQRKEAVGNLRALGNKKAIGPLRKARSRMRTEGGLIKKKVNTNACLRSDAAEAIRYLQSL